MAFIWIDGVSRLSLVVLRACNLAGQADSRLRVVINSGAAPPNSCVELNDEFECLLHMYIPIYPQSVMADGGTS